ALGVNRRVGINGRAKIRNHPLVDGVLTVVALPIGKAGAGDGGAKTVGLRDGPHGHVPAIAPPGDADALRVDRRRAKSFIDTCEDVAQIASAEIFDVGARESFALPVAA